MPKLRVISILVCVYSLCILCCNVLFANAAELKDYLNDPAYSDTFWQTSIPEAEGLDENLLLEAVAWIAQQGYEIHSFSIIKNGKLILDRYGVEIQGGNSRQRTPAEPHELHSTTKTFTSALLGIAIDEGLIPGVHSRVMEYFRDDAVENMSPQKQSLTIEQLLTMQSGLQYTEGADDSLFWQSSPSALAFLGRPVVSQPGTVWNYSSGNSQIMAEILRKATGKTPLAYGMEKIFRPLEITPPKWMADNSGTNFGGWGLFLTPRDLARFGYLYLKNGQWGDARIISEEWIAAATKAHTNTPWAGGQYAYHCWVPRVGGFATTGYMGQDMFIFPEHDLIVVFTAALPYQQADQIEIGIVDAFVLKAIRK